MSSAASGDYCAFSNYRCRVPLLSPVIVFTPPAVTRILAVVSSVVADFAILRTSRRVSSTLDVAVGGEEKQYVK